ncbi:MAG TPA: LysR family transcriptional regulator [Acidimicrobiales bacterium]|jgi:DNA-binding transcriptional LysR family regulator|nr:LysR family transcriptional regulator [Acidimicrobiales bacterium]
MDLRQLNALLAVAEHGGFSAAARALHTVQSNVSTHVARLEKELGATLIDRATGRPTKEGEAVLTRAIRIRAELEALSSDVASLGARVAGTARLGMIGTTARWLAPLLFEALEEHYPEVRMVLVDATTTSLLPRVDRGDLDLAIVNLPAESMESQAEPLFDEDRILLVPPDHPLGAAPTVALRALADYDLLLEPVGTAFRDELDVQAAAVGVRLRARAEIDGMRLLASLVIAGFGAAVLPASAVPAVPPRADAPWRVIAVDGLQPRTVGLAQRRRGLLSSPAAAVRDLLVDVVATGVAERPGLHPVTPT